MRAGASPHSQSNSPRNSPKFPPRNSSRLLSSQNGNFTTSTNLNLNGNNRRYFNNNNNDFAPPPGTPTRSSGSSTGSGGRHTATLLASLDKSILQIRDWLTLLESMIKKDRVDLANRGNIYHMLERQKVGKIHCISAEFALIFAKLSVTSKQLWEKSLKALNSLELLSLLFFIA